MLKKAFSRMALPLAIVAGAVLVNPAVAQASAFTCALSHGLGGATCMYVNGTADWVEDTTIEHDHGMEPDNVCDRQVKATYTVRSGAQWVSFSAVRYGCAISVDIRLTIKMYMYDPSYFYGDAKHDGAWAPGRPRITVSA